jgi:hypothetical protein
LQFSIERKADRHQIERLPIPLLHQYVNIRPYFMNRLSLILLSLSFGCNNSQVNKLSDSTSVAKIDFNQSRYKLFLGQTKDSLQKSITITRDFENDRSVSGTNSSQHYMNISEDLIKIINNDTVEVLPALYFTFDKGILTSFECAIDYELQEKSLRNLNTFIEALTPHFAKLNSVDNRTKLSQQLFLQFDNANRKETFSLDTIGKPNGILFVYKTSLK